MNAVKKISAAIERLEKLRGREKWKAVHRSILTEGGGEVIAEHVFSDDVLLIVTLHRTIDAQLKILWSSLDGAHDLLEGCEPDEPAATADGIALAAAILGDSA